MNERHRDLTSLAYAPAGLLVIYVLIRIVF
jgi:hypothetical protein